MDAAGPPADHGAAVPPVGVTLQWLGDDPSWGRTPVHDLDWVKAQQVLAADPAFLTRRASVSHLRLFLTVRPVPPGDDQDPPTAPHSLLDGFRPVREAAVLNFETDEGPGVVLVLPVTDFPAAGPRVDSYTSAVNTLMDAALREP